MDSFLCLIYGQLFCTSSGMGSPSLDLFINSCFIHHMVWTTSSILSIYSCLVHHLVCVVLHWPYSSIVVSYIVWYGFLYLSHPPPVVCALSGLDYCICLVHQQLFCISFDMVSPPLASSINSCCVHHTVCIPSYLSSISSCFVHNLVWVVLRWSHPSPAFSYIVWYGYLHLSQIWVILRWSRPSIVISCIIWYGFRHLYHPWTVVLYMGSPSWFSSINSCFIHHLL